MLKRDRPWDKAKRGPPPPKEAKQESADVPYVDIAGIKFYSDRFYLNITLLDDDIVDENVSSATENDVATGSFRCNCGAKEPPPLFSRSALLQSCSKLKAVVIGTYSFDLVTMKQEFPTLFGAAADTPCLVLHGKKGWTKTTKVDSSEDHPESGSSVDDFSYCVESKVDGCASLGTQDEETMEISNTYYDAHQSYRFIDTLIEKECSEAVPESVFFSEITSTWLKPDDIPSSFSSAVDKDTGFLRQSVLDNRVSKRGVHHPKFMLLLEESGSIVVVVSTANVTPAVTTDASWVQRFPAATMVEKLTLQTSKPTNDFGTVLANFLQCQMLASAAKQVTTHWFVKKFLGWKSVVDLERMFDYSSAQVQLVATVPGEYEIHDVKNIIATKVGKHGDPNASTPKQLLYGQQRISDCLTQLSLPRTLMTDQDRLIIQPTSFGSDWNSRNMTYLVRSYLTQHKNTKVPDHALLERLDIIWPTEHFVREAVRNLRGRNTPTLVNSHKMGFVACKNDLGETFGTEKSNEGYLFLSSETFNKIDLACLNRMVMFEPSNPPQQPVVLTPHFKSAARVFRGCDVRIQNDYGVVKCEDYFSWFLLTSSCLSRGAQGDPVVDASLQRKSNKVEYANFELGVLFTSRLKQCGRSHEGRIYCWKPVQCMCSMLQTATSKTRLVHLPSPFSFRPSCYVEDKDDAILCETPYFHEIPPGTGCVGNMLLTPHGAALAAHFEKKSRFKD